MKAKDRQIVLERLRIRLIILPRGAERGRGEVNTWREGGRKKVSVKDA